MNSEKGQEQKIVYYQERSYCNREDCLVCNINEGHGPYWYASMEIDNRTHRIYLGNKFTPVARENFLQSQAFQQEANPENYFEEKQGAENDDNESDNKPDYLIDRIDTSKIPKKNNRILNTKRIPTQQEFEEDLRSLGRENTKSKLRTIYRQLIKKYHPDQFENKSNTNFWMAEINNIYQSQLKKAN